MFLSLLHTSAIHTSSNHIDKQLINLPSPSCYCVIGLIELIELSELIELIGLIGLVLLDMICCHCWMDTYELDIENLEIYNSTILDSRI